MAVVESGRLGGTCVNVGCVPKKVTWSACALLESFHDMGGYGIEASHPSFNWKTLVDNRSAFVARLNGVYQKNLESSNVTILRGRGSFVGPRRVKVNDEVISADHVLIATGGRPLVPLVPGAEFGITSDDFFDLQSLPKRGFQKDFFFCLFV